MKRLRHVRMVNLVAAWALVVVFGVPVVESGSAAHAAGSAQGPAYTATKQLTRSYLNADGSESMISQNTVTVNVDQTQQLRGRQDVTVSWSGAHPTGGIQPDYNAVQAPNSEYPVAVIECRGADSTSAPAGQQVSPATCLTHGSTARFQAASYTPVAPWRLDRYASAADRAAVVGRPPDATIPDCPAVGKNERWLPYVSVDNTTYNYGNDACAGLPPGDFKTDTSAQAVPPNATFAPTTADGTGSIKFNMWTEAESATLGCSATVACSLEVIPIIGISCDPYGVSPASAPLPAEDVAGSADIAKVTAQCETNGNFAAGDPANISQSASLPVSGVLWWSPSNWRNRFSVPLNFAPVSHACDVVSSGAPVAVYGSELMTDATGQWAPQFCSDPSLFKLTHVQTSEPLARTLLADTTSGVHAAFSAQSPTGGFPAPTVQAPVAVTGFSISYNIDDVGGRAVTNLRMTPRLLAKLLAESYPGEVFDRFAPGQFPYLAHNPVNITGDPEFQALNPGISASISSPGAATLIALSSESDVIYAVTAYINADPEARAWLSGKPDPWGMVVNPAYKSDKLTLPVTRWPLNDQTLPNFGGQSACQQQDPSPWLPLVASPTPNLAATTLAVQFSSPPSKTNCKPVADIPGAPVQWGTIGRSLPGHRFVIGVTTLGEAAHYDLQTAALQSHASVTNPSARFTNGNGRTFVSPTDQSMKAAADLFTQDGATNAWTVPYDTLRTSAAGTTAYPGTLLVYGDVPTRGLAGTDATDLAKLLRYAAGPGQSPGTGNGQLPAGYLPMTAANGLGAEVDYTTRAAAAVAAQKGTVPPLVAVPGQPVIGTVPPPHVGLDGFGSGPASSGGSNLPAGKTTPGAKTSHGPAPSGSSSLVGARASTPAMTSALAGMVLPTIIGGGLLAALVSGGFLVRPRPRVPGRRRR
jgi:hypothetical protein